MDVVGAGREHLIEVTRVLHAAFYEAYTGLLRAETIGHVLAAEQSPSALKRRMLAGEMFVAVDDGTVVGCAIAEHRGDHVEVPAIVVDPAYRGRGIGGGLLDEVREGNAGLPVSIDVLLGSVEGERFVEGHGFVPGETIQRVLGREEVVVRRWWQSAD